MNRVESIDFKGEPAAGEACTSEMLVPDLPVHGGFCGCSKEN